MTVRHPRRVRSSILVAVLASLAFASAATAGGPGTPGDHRELLAEINSARAEHGRGPLRLSAVLTRPARRHTAYLARTGVLDHEGVDGRPFSARLYAAGFSRKKAVGEVLGMASGCQTDIADLVVEMWLASPGHRRNLLSPRFRVVGVAVAADAGCRRTVYTVDFGG